jgi:hypothetical protein
VTATGADNRVVVLASPDAHVPDHPDTVTYDDLVATLKAETEPVSPSKHVDEAPRGHDAIGV